MAEESAEATAPAKKKKSKIPVFLAMIALLGAGGFFGMKLKSGPAAPPPMKLGAIEPIDEFLVNLRDGRTYLKIQMAFHFSDQFQKASLEKNLPAVRDVVIAELTSLGPNDLMSASGKTKLKRRIAESVNKLFASLGPEKKEKEKEKGKKDDKAEKKPEAKKKEEPGHPDWDSETGPVLRVYFTNLATQ